MSVRYVNAVKQSALPRALKAVAKALAEYASDEDGSRIRVSMDRVAWEVGLSVRAVQYHVATLREMKILEQLAPASQHQPVHYRLVLERLPQRAPFRSAGVQLAAPLDDPSGVQPASPLK